MNRALKTWFTAAATLLAVGAVAVPALATTRTTSANIGMPGEGHAASDFFAHLGSIKYTGTGTAWWEITLVADQTAPFPGGFTPTIVGFNASSLSCATRWVDPDGLTFGGTSLSPMGSGGTLTPGSIGSLPSDGSAVVDCLMGPNSKIMNVTY